ncbi:MAG TPA: cytochrome P450 [Acidimicrobiales bacterium]|nr:cytochrome P450 [Acidimicrobiales bacterium]
MSQTALPSDLGRIFADPAFYADPAAWHESAAILRRESPITKVTIPGYEDFWAVTKHADIMEIERNPDVFTNAPYPTIGPIASRPNNAEGGNPVNTLIQMDGKEHKDHRNIVNEWFKPASIKRMNDRVAELATQFVDRMEAMDGECDFANDIAMHYPLQVILSILGLPEEDHLKMLKLTQELFGAEDPDIGRAGEDGAILQVLLDFVAYFTTLAADRRSHPTEDLASVIANAMIDGDPLADMDVMGFYLIVATAGHDTTSNSLAGGLLALLENPDQSELLQADPGLVAHATDELIRYVSPVKHFLRHCQEPYEVRGVSFRPGDVALLSFASGNRDDDVFDAPFRLDVQRANASSHLAFGFGRHFCLGAHLARLEIRAFFRELLTRVRTIELAGTPTFVQSNLVSGPKTLPIRFQFR